MVRIENLGKDYRLGDAVVSALGDVTAEIPPARFTVVAGPSGCGKSTLLNLIGGLERPTRGAILIEGRDIASLGADALADFRASHLGFVFQTFNLLPVLTAEENIEYPLLLGKLGPEKRRQRVDEMLQAVGLSSVARHRPAQLSGGQRQRVAIARALTAHPRLILADEPTANLDRRTGQEIVALLKDLNKRGGATLVMATHDPAIMSQADRVIHLCDGRVQETAECS